MTRDQHWLLTQRRRHRRDQNDLRPLHVIAALGCWATIVLAVVVGWIAVAKVIE